MLIHEEILNGSNVVEIQRKLLVGDGSKFSICQNYGWNFRLYSRVVLIFILSIFQGTYHITSN